MHCLRVLRFPSRFEYEEGRNDERETERDPRDGIPNAIAKQGGREPCCTDDPDQRRHQEYIARRIDRLSLTGHPVCTSAVRLPERRLASRAAEVFEPELRFANHR